MRRSKTKKNTSPKKKRAVKRSRKTAKKTSRAKKVRTSRKAPYRILVAEDNVVNQKVTLEMLRSLGFMADVVSNGKEAIRALATHPYDLVLMDCQMPQIDGYAATMAIRTREEAKGRRVPIVALTAHALTTDRDKSFQSGMDDYLSKPVEPATLRATIERWVERSRKDKAWQQAVAVGNSMTGAPKEKGREILDRTILAELRVFQKEGQRDLIGELVELFLQYAPKHLAEVREAIQAKDTTLIAKSAHDLKSSSGNLGATTLANDCAKLEVLARAGNLEGALKLIAQIEDHYTVVKQALEAEIKTSRSNVA